MRGVLVLPWECYVTGESMEKMGLYVMKSVTEGGCEIGVSWKFTLIQ